MTGPRIVPLIAGGQRPRSDKTHFATRHIQQLRPFVQESAAQENTQPRHAGIALQFKKPIVMPQLLL